MAPLTPVETRPFQWSTALVLVGGVLVAGKMAEQSGWLDGIERGISDDDNWRAVCLVYAVAVAGAFYLGSKSPEARPGILTWFLL